MRDISSLIEASLLVEEGKMFWLLELQFDNTIRYTDCDIDLWDFPPIAAPIDYLITESGDYLITESGDFLILKETTISNKFETMPFSIENINYTTAASVDNVTINIENVDLQMSAIFLNEDIMNKWGILSLIFLDENNKVIDQPIEVFRGLVSTWKLSESKASMTLVNEFIFWNKKTLRDHKPSCGWAFKGVECTYTGGETWCDKSYARCTALGNTDNYEGCRWLPALMETEIYWGRTTT